MPSPEPLRVYQQRDRARRNRSRCRVCARCSNAVRPTQGWVQPGEGFVCADCLTREP